MTSLTTSDEVLKKISAAAKKSLTEQEIREQRISFVLSSVDDESSITKDQVEKVLQHFEGH